MLRVVLPAVTGTAGAEDPVERTDWPVQNHRQEPGGKGSPQQPPFNLGRRDGGWWLGEVQVSGSEAWAKLAVPPSLRNRATDWDPDTHQAKGVRAHDTIPSNAEHFPVTSVA